MAQTKLFLIEGLPGSGKSTTAQLVFDQLSRMGVNACLFQEGNLDHPADYDGWSYFTESQFHSLLAEHKALEDTFRQAAEKRAGGFLLERRKLTGSFLPEKLQNFFYEHDIYELPFGVHTELALERWQNFADQAEKGDLVYVFECCFIQNPATIGMVKCGMENQEVLAYVKKLEAAIEPLNPVLIYVDQENIRDSFGKALRERPAEWSQGFMEYYTQQGIGLKQGAKGLEGTLAVLEARRDLEAEIMNDLAIDSFIVDNSRFDMETISQKISQIINTCFDAIESGGEER